MSQCDNTTPYNASDYDAGVRKDISFFNQKDRYKVKR
jgi:hypothetical protein